jgi:hypothetical protein
LQSGLVATPSSALEKIVAEKSEKARSWNWRTEDGRPATERWLLVIGKAQTLSDTMILAAEPPGTFPSTTGFTHVLAWDAFFEQVHQVHPLYQLVAEYHPYPVYRRHRFPSRVAEFVQDDA